MPINLNLEKINKENGQVLNADDLKKPDDNVDKIQNAFNNLDNNKANIVYENPITPTLINNWVNYGDGYSEVSYWKDSLGCVHLKGTIKNGITNSICFTLPMGYRPINNIIFSCAGDGKTDQGDLTGVCQTLITNDGTISPLLGVSTLTGLNMSKVSLDGIIFRVGV